MTDESRRRGRIPESRTRDASPAEPRVVPVPAGSLLTDAEIQVALEKLSAAKAYGNADVFFTFYTPHRGTTKMVKDGWILEKDPPRTR